MEGAFAIGLVTANEPDAIYLIKTGSPMVIGIGKERCFWLRRLSIRGAYIGSYFS